MLIKTAFICFPSFIPAQVRLALWCWDGSTRVKRK
nr:MAG TPA: hypothetical protein [Caudoviricetes sp.]